MEQFVSDRRNEIREILNCPHSSIVTCLIKQMTSRGAGREFTGSER